MNLHVCGLGVGCACREFVSSSFVYGEKHVGMLQVTATIPGSVRTGGSTPLLDLKCT